MLVLDPREMKPVVVELQFVRARPSLWPTIVDAGEDKLGMVFVYGEHKGTLYLYCKTWWNNNGGAKDWQHKIISLQELGYDWYMLGVADGNLGPSTQKIVYYILELKTLLFLRVGMSDMFKA